MTDTATRTTSLDRMRETQPEDTLIRLDRIRQINRGYVTNPYDKLLSEQFDAMRENQMAFDPDDPVSVKACRKRGLLVIGEAGSGKSTAISRILGKAKGLDSYCDGEGGLIKPLVSMKAPKPLTIRFFAETGLASLGYPIVSGQRSETQTWSFFLEQLEEREALWLFVDEMQHLMRTAGFTAKTDITDLVKNLLQLERWPLMCIFAGVGELAQFLRYDKRQIDDRTTKVRFDPLRIGPDTRKIVTMIAGVITRHAEMVPGEGIDTEEFANRLLLASSGAWGTAIMFVREAIFAALRQGRETVKVEDFVAFYRQATGCLPDQNIFAAAVWKDIKPGNAVYDYIQKHEEEEKRLNENGGRKR